MNPYEVEVCKAAADAICCRVEDKQIVGDIPEYRPKPKQKEAVVQDDSEPQALRASADVM